MNWGQSKFVGVTYDRPLAAVAHALGGDVANVIRIEALGPPPIIVNGSTNPKPTLKRVLRLRLGLLDESPTTLLPERARGVWPLSSNVDRLAYRPNCEGAARDSLR